MPVSFLIKLQALAYIFITKETLALVFSREFRKIFKNTFFTEYLWATTSTKTTDKQWLEKKLTLDKYLLKSAVSLVD